METGISMIIIEPRLVLRQALELLMGNHSYRVMCGVGSITEIASSLMADRPDVVILGAQSANSASNDADDIRSIWPDSKIVILFDDASTTDFQNLRTSQIDGCIPLLVSPDTLIRTLDLIVSSNVRVIVMSHTRPPSKWPSTEGESSRPAVKVDKSKWKASGRDVGTVTLFGVPPFPDTAMEVRNSISDSEHMHIPLVTPKLSGREVQILDGLIKGYANKVIARRCDIAEATVKVHMKSILRKIRVENRTQAAIWALEHGYCSDEPKSVS
jgi:two-component system nitrate/nitrite response regulator NarL